MKTALMLGLSILTVGSSYAPLANAAPALTPAQVQQAARLHDTDLLALRVLVQLDYMQKTRQIDFAKLGQGMDKNNSAVSAGLGALQAVNSIGAAGGALATSSFVENFRTPGTYYVTHSNASSIIGERTGNYTETIVVTRLDALKAAGPIVGAAAVSSLFAGFFYEDQKLMNRPVDSKLGRYLMGFDSQVGSLITSNINDLSTVLGFSAAQKQELKDAVAEDVAQQVAKLVPTKVAGADVGDGITLAPSQAINIDILKIANQLKMVDEPAKQSLRDIAAVVLSPNAQAKANITKFSATDVQQRLALMTKLNELIAEASAKSPKAQQALAALSLRTSLAVSALKAAQ